MEFKESNSFLNKYVYKNVELVIYLLVGLLIPVFIGHPQIVVGIVVNAILASAAIRKMSMKKSIALAVTPSIGAVMNGVLFGGLTNFLLYFIPIIWISNLLYMKLIKIGKHKWPAGAIFRASVLKSGILFATAVIFVSMSLVPQPFLIVMSVIQITTALIGGSVAMVINNTILKKV